MEDKELKALISLLDDEDHEVSTHVEQKIISIGTSIIPDLEREWESNFNPEIQRKIEDLIHTLQFDLLQERLEDWKNSGFEDLMKGMWLVATYQYPDLEYSELTQELEQIYYEVWTEFKPDLTPYDQVRILNSVIFDKLKFRANTKNFHSPANSMINIVMQSKKGNPITLCVIYMMIAQKLELPIYGVNLPNLFILTYKDDKTDNQFYINVFNKGLVFSTEDIDNYISHLGITSQEIFYQPCTNLDIVMRAMRNLIVSFEKLGEYSRSDEVKILLKSMEDFSS
ncbi:MAG: transglutaminase-like domain-containing protein [bacterium]|nr:transglutaminase-like domain-containing protein [bacterium]